MSTEASQNHSAKISDYTFVLKLTDRPGAMELIAATFAHRGISLTATLGNDGTLDPSGNAVILLHFRATPSRKETLKRTLTRLSRVVSLVEHAPHAPHLRSCALLRLAPGATVPDLAPDFSGAVEQVESESDAIETTWAILGPVSAVNALLESARGAGVLRGATQTILAL
jgi:hypothetical protein